MKRRKEPLPGKTIIAGKPAFVTGHVPTLPDAELKKYAEADVKATRSLQRKFNPPSAMQAIVNFLDFMERYDCRVKYEKDGRDAGGEDGVLEEFEALADLDEERAQAVINCEPPLKITTLQTGEEIFVTVDIHPGKPKVIRAEIAAVMPQMNRIELRYTKTKKKIPGSYRAEELRRTFAGARQKIVNDLLQDLAILNDTIERVRSLEEPK